MNLVDDLGLRLLRAGDGDASIILLGKLARVDHFLEDGGRCSLIRIGSLELLYSLLECVPLRHLFLNGLLLDLCFLLLLIDLYLSSSPLGLDF